MSKKKHTSEEEEGVTDQEINIAIAEACGWKYHAGLNCELYHFRCWSPPGKWSQHWRSNHVVPPNYCTDLNAMHEAEERLTEREIADYHFWIIDNDDTNATHFVPGACPTSRNLWYLTHATARQRAEAFLRTIGKWKE